MPLISLFRPPRAKFVPLVCGKDVSMAGKSVTPVISTSTRGESRAPHFPREVLALSEEDTPRFERIAALTNKVEGARATPRETPVLLFHLKSSGAESVIITARSGEGSATARLPKAS